MCVCVCVCMCVTTVCMYACVRACTCVFVPGRCDESCEKDEDCSGSLSCRCNKCGCGKDLKCIIRPEHGWNYQGTQMTADCIPLNGMLNLHANVKLNVYT